MSRRTFYGSSAGLGSCHLFIASFILVTHQPKSFYYVLPRHSQVIHLKFEINFALVSLLSPRQMFLAAIAASGRSGALSVSFPLYSPSDRPPRSRPRRGPRLQSSRLVSRAKSYPNTFHLIDKVIGVDSLKSFLQIEAWPKSYD